ncbi:endosomal/lysosomal proton channel TMEM175 [Hydra vulgaris]|uniref:endosomal/lysosomal proton channel TMEM175 n=1 Tax=Hydra vulgaris TaxID=6087 RepID=UPI001F5F0213|nr:endosomal/lysosomal potassium channel TMEM175 [Hydra vulgaris]
MNLYAKKKFLNQNESFMIKNNNKHLEKYYDEHVDKTLPEDYHRGDITSLKRMLAYFDAMMAACATFLVIPLRNLDLQEDTQSLLQFLASISSELIEYFVGFQIVLLIWENMNNRAIVIKRVDDFILTLVIFEMLVTSFLPFSLALQGHYPREKVSFLTTCVILGILQVIDIVIVLYAIHSPNLLHVNLKNWAKSELQDLILIMVFRPLVSFFLIIIAGAFVLVHYGVSWAFIALLIIIPTIRKIYWFVRRRVKKLELTEKNLFLDHFCKGNVPKERVEIMSDAAVAIVACILILDITDKKFPKKVDVNENGLVYKLSDMASEFFIYVASFCLVSALWYVNYAVLHLFKTVNSVVLYLQKAFLLFCCLCPLAGNMVLLIANKDNIETNIAIRYSAGIIFFSSISNFFIVVYGLLTGEKYFHEWASVKHFKKNKREHLYTLAKVLNLPLWSIFCFLGSLGSSSSAIYILYITSFGAPFSFFAFKFIFMNYLSKITALFLRQNYLVKENKELYASKEISLRQMSFSTVRLDNYVIRNENFN